MKIAVPDFITNSYFPAVAAVELGFFKEEGINMELEHIFPVNKACEVMRDGGIDFVAGAAHAPIVHGMWTCTSPFRIFRILCR